MKKYTLTYNGIVIGTHTTQKNAKTQFNATNKNTPAIKKIIADIENDGGIVSSNLYLDKIEGDYEYPKYNKEI